MWKLGCFQSNQFCDDALAISFTRTFLGNTRKSKSFGSTTASNVKRGYDNKLSIVVSFVVHIGGLNFPI